MADDSKLRDLLDKAGRLYNDGKYSEAIAAWQEVLAIEPGNQKAREGIRMAQLLVVNWETSSGAEGEAELQLEPGGADAEAQEKIDIGISRVRELMTEGRYQEALEGCQLLAELAPGMPSVKNLMEEVTQAFEAQPFIKERVERAKKYLQQGKTREAAEESRNVLSVDRHNQEAQAILSQATGAPAGDSRSKPPSAFQVEKAGKALPPSPFSQRPDTDALLAQFDFEAEPTPSGPARAKAAPQQSRPSGQEPLDPGIPPGGPAGAGSMSAAAAGPADPRLRPLIEEGKKHLSEKNYQAAIDTWSRVFGFDESNAEAGELIDKAKTLMDDLARQADEAYYRGVDYFESGLFDEAKRAFEEVLAVQQDHAEARTYLIQIQEKAAASAKGAAPASAPPPRAAAAPPKAAEALDDSSVPLAAPSPRSIPPKTPARMEPAVSAGPMKKKPVVPVARPSRARAFALGGLGAVVVLAGGGYLFLSMMGGSGPRPEPAGPSSAALAGPSSGEPPVEPPADPAPPVNDAPGKEGGLVVVPGAPQPPAPAQTPAPDPAATRRRIDALMREGRALMNDEKYTEAAARFEQALGLDPTNFEAEDLKTKSAAAAVRQSRFNRELEVAKAAFAEGDWAGSLYKLYRLREENRDRADLVRFIKNANYNWGIEALGQFETDQAAEHFKDALEMAPGDPVASKHLEVATRYRRRPRDAAYDAYVRNLKPRELEER